MYRIDNCDRKEKPRGDGQTTSKRVGGETKVTMVLLSKQNASALPHPLTNMMKRIWISRENELPLINFTDMKQ